VAGKLVLILLIASVCSKHAVAQSDSTKTFVTGIGLAFRPSLGFGKTGKFFKKGERKDGTLIAGMNHVGLDYMVWLTKPGIWFDIDAGYTKYDFTEIDKYGSAWGGHLEVGKAVLTLKRSLGAYSLSTQYWLTAEIIYESLNPVAAEIVGKSQLTGWGVGLVHPAFKIGFSKLGVNKFLGLSVVMPYFFNW